MSTRSSSRVTRVVYNSGTLSQSKPFSSIAILILLCRKLIYSFPWTAPSAITNLAQSPVIDVVALGCLDGTIQVWNIKLDKMIIEYKQEDRVTGISFRTGELTRIH